MASNKIGLRALSFGDPAAEQQIEHPPGVHRVLRRSAARLAAIATVSVLRISQNPNLATGHMRLRPAKTNMTKASAVGEAMIGLRQSIFRGTGRFAGTQPVGGTRHQPGGVRFAPGHRRARAAPAAPAVIPLRPWARLTARGANRNRQLSARAGSARPSDHRPRRQALSRRAGQYGMGR